MMAGWICLSIATSGLLLYFFSRLEARHRYRKEREKKAEFRVEMMSQHRVLDWTEVATKLEKGEGTLIVQHLLPKGPVRDWWVPDDLIALAPIALPRLAKAPLEEPVRQRVSEYAAACQTKYTDSVSGTALLTDYPLSDVEQRDSGKLVVVDLGDGFMTAIRLTTGRKLDSRFPKAKVITLICWSDPPFIAVGDAENVFLGLLSASRSLLSDR